MSQENLTSGERPPIVAIVGHIDHGKSTLLDYIRKTNITEKEAGGITQHLSAYEAQHTNATGTHHITFLDTPGHEAFRAMRLRGLEVADVAVLVVSAEDGAKPQTLEAVKLIEETKIPYIVAITKIDKPGADVEKAKMSLLENGIYLEGLGGEIPFTAISSKSGEGIPELLDLILLAGELEGLSADPDKAGEGLVIEAHLDPKRGNAATLIVQDGSVESGEFIISGESMAPVRIMENYVGKAIKVAGPGSPILIVGFSSLPQIGAKWRCVETKKEAEQEVSEAKRNPAQKPSSPQRGEFSAKNSPTSGAVAPAYISDELVSASTATESAEPAEVMNLPIVIKTDFAGTGDAVVHEIEKLPKHARLNVHVVGRGTGPISKSDVELVGSGAVPGIILGFNVKADRDAVQLAERLGVSASTFSIIYELTKWLGEEIEKRRPRAQMEEKTGSAKLLKVFSTVKNKVVVGGRVDEGEIVEGADIKIIRRDVEVGRGTISSLQSQKSAAKKVEKGNEFGAMLKIDFEPAAGDTLEVFAVVTK
ncbi:GTP-binding protein [Patescibacteria group bacterium]|nr:GTP-binding protein [Patescibacteria group bacterium]